MAMWKMYFRNLLNTAGVEDRNEEEGEDYENIGGYEEGNNNIDRSEVENHLSY